MLIFRGELSAFSMLRIIVIIYKHNMKENTQKINNDFVSRTKLYDSEILIFWCKFQAFSNMRIEFLMFLRQKIQKRVLASRYLQKIVNYCLLRSQPYYREMLIFCGQFRGFSRLQTTVPAFQREMRKSSGPCDIQKTIKDCVSPTQPYDSGTLICRSEFYAFQGDCRPKLFLMIRRNTKTVVRIVKKLQNSP